MTTLILPRNARWPLAGLFSLFVLLSEGCTGQLPGAFRLQQASQTFASSQAINTKVDMLWVVDNSASMDPSQKSLRNGFAVFAEKYMQPTWDIQVGVITSDTYLANARYSAYRTSKQADFPRWYADWGKLLPGNHDGPMASKCSNANVNYFWRGYGQCNVRNSQTGGGITGVAECLNPPTGQDSSVLCVNTLVNDNIHSGVPLVKTILPQGQDAYTWTQQLVTNFMTNVSTGANGSGVERGLGSLLQFVEDNEKDTQGAAPNHLFRPGSLRVIIFVSDEDDQTVDPAVNTATDPSTGYVYDSHDPGDGGTGTCRVRTVPCTSGTCTQIPCANDHNAICTNPDPTNYTYTISYCAPQPESTTLMPVANVKTKLDDFFNGLDGVTGGTGASGNYFVASVVPLSGESLMALHESRGDEDAIVVGHRRVSSDYGSRYVAFDQAVGNGSFEMELVDPANPDTTDFTPILEKIGQVIVGKKATFTLDRAPTGQEDMIVTINHIDGSVTVVKSSQYKIEGKELSITDMNVVLGFSATDQIGISYQPSTVF